MATFSSAHTDSAPSVTALPRAGSAPVDTGGAQVGRALGTIALRGVAAVGHHGVFDFERTQGQRFVADVVCRLDLSPAARSDALADTIDYAALASRIAADIERDPLNLIEALADRIARTCLTDERVSSVEVTVHKPEAPMPVDVADVAVTVQVSRDDLGRPGAGRAARSEKASRYE